MDSTSPVLIIMHGGTGNGTAERMMTEVRAVSAAATAAAAVQAGFDAAIIVTDSPDVFGAPPTGVLVDADPPGPPFRFDERLRGVVHRWGLERPVVMGSGAGLLLVEGEWRHLATRLREPGERLVTNNFFSGDVTGWTPGSALERVSAYDRDNQLPRRLRDDCGLTAEVLPRTTGTQFDVDTPADLAVLALQDHLPGPIRTIVDRYDLPLDRYRRTMRVLCDPQAELIVAGRVGSQAWQYVERETACRVRIFSEERGMAAAGSAHRPRSLLGYAIEDTGYEAFFRRMAGLGDALVLDTRVIEAHLGLRPSREDRFQSDLFRAELVNDRGLRELTEAARSAPIPVLLGGHSLVSGGLMALNDAAWSEHDRGQGLLT